MALQNGHRIVRLAYNIPLTEIRKYIEEGLNCKDREYFSDVEKYKWLI